jgi:drug/metabolite transporter (DMT)-like permease
MKKYLPHFKTISNASIARQLSAINPMQLRKKGTHAKALIALSLVGFLWGTTWLASKGGVKGMPALQMAGMRQTMGGSIYIIWFLLKGEQWPKGKQWLSIIVLSFLNFMIANGLSTWGLKFISSGLGAIMGAVFPLWLVIIALVTGNTKLNTKAIVGFLLGFAGICVIFYEHLHDFFNPDFSFGIILSLAATLAWAFGTVYTKQYALEFNPYFSIGLQMFISGITLCSVAKVTGATIPLQQIPATSWVAITYLVLIGSVFSFLAYLYALQNLPTAQVSVYAYINPIVAVLMAAWLFKEKLTFYIAAGGLITLSGVYLVNEAFKKKLP